MDALCSTQYPKTPGTRRYIGEGITTAQTTSLPASTVEPKQPIYLRCERQVVVEGQVRGSARPSLKLKRALSAHVPLHSTVDGQAHHRALASVASWRCRAPHWHTPGWQSRPSRSMSMAPASWPGLEAASEQIMHPICRVPVSCTASVSQLHVLGRRSLDAGRPVD